MVIKSEKNSDSESLLKRIDALNRNIGELEYRTESLEGGSTPWMLATGVLALAIIISAVGFANGSIRVNAAGLPATGTGTASDLNVEGMYNLMLEKGLPTEEIDTILMRGGIQKTDVDKIRYKVTATSAEPVATPTAKPPTPTEKTTGGASPTPKPKPSGTGQKVDFQMFVMTYCPFGTQAEAGMIDAWDRIGKYVDLDVRFVIYSQYQGGGDDYCIDNGELCSMHGIAELNEGIRQACIMKYYDIDKWVEYTKIINAQCSLGDIETCWKGIAKDVGVDVDKISTCQKDEGVALMRADKKEGDALGVRGSPTMFINGAPYSSGRDALSYTRAICNELNNEPPECSSLPACGQDADCTKTGKIGKCVNPNTDDAVCEFIDPVTVKLTILNKQSDPSCDSSQIEAALVRLFPGVDVEEVDVASAEGKALVEKYDVLIVPKFILDDNLENTNTWDTNVGIRSVFEKKGDIWMLGDDATGASCYISDEAKAAAEEAACAEIPKADVPTMKMFVMTYCPFGTQALDGIKPVVELLGDKVDVEPHYVIYANYNGGGPDYCLDDDSKYCSMHGIQELNEGVRQLCIYRDQRDKWWDYYSLVSKGCSSNNVDTCWEDKAKSAGVDIDAVKKCYEEDALTMLAEEVKLNEKYGARGSPTMVINEVAYQGNRDPESFKSSLCCGFKEGQRPSACDTKLAGGGAASAPQGNC
ncbi:MAG: hypothetical protein QGG50_02970 [Methanopyri archaeon]|jgi:predicted DsbA family dithiol-disulfide isomerase|nr:hypothetical protein [Methanopyri archaeon]